MKGKYNLVLRKAQMTKAEPDDAISQMLGPAFCEKDSYYCVVPFDRAQDGSGYLVRRLTAFPPNIKTVLGR